MRGEPSTEEEETFKTAPLFCETDMGNSCREAAASVGAQLVHKADGPLPLMVPRRRVGLSSCVVVL